MSKKMVLLVLLVSCILLTPTVCLASFTFTVDSVYYVVDGESLVMDVAPFIKNDRTYMPIRSLGEALGADVKWDADKRVVTMIKKGKNVQFKIGSTTMTVDSINTQMDVSPEIVNDRVVLPFRWVAKAFGMELNWDKDKKTISYGIEQDKPIKITPDASISDINKEVSDYFMDKGNTYFNNQVIPGITLSGNENHLVYNIRLDFNDVENPDSPTDNMSLYDELTDFSTNQISSFMEAVRTRIDTSVEGTVYKNAAITGSLVDDDKPSSYVKDYGGRYTFSWQKNKTTFDDITNNVSDFFKNAGNDYFNDNSIVTTISLSGDGSELEYTVTFDLSDSHNYKYLKSLNEEKIKVFLNDVRLEIKEEAYGTKYVSADINGKLLDADHSDMYVKYEDKSYTYSW